MMRHFRQPGALLLVLIMLAASLVGSVSILAEDNLDYIDAQGNSDSDTQSNSDAGIQRITDQGSGADTLTPTDCDEGLFAGENGSGADAEKQDSDSDNYNVDSVDDKDLTDNENAVEQNAANPNSADMSITNIREIRLDDNRKGKTYTVKGTVTKVNGRSVYIDDGTGGICIDILNGASDNIAPGKVVTASGEFDIIRGFGELKNVPESSLIIESGSGNIPMTEQTIGVIRSDNENYKFLEAAFVSIKDAIVTNIEGTVFEISQDDAGMAKTILVRNVTLPSDIELGDKINIKGIVWCYDAVCISEVAANDIELVEKACKTPEVIEDTPDKKTDDKTAKDSNGSADTSEAAGGDQGSDAGDNNATDSSKDSGNDKKADESKSGSDTPKSSGNSTSSTGTATGTVTAQPRTMTPATAAPTVVASADTASAASASNNSSRTSAVISASEAADDGEGTTHISAEEIEREAETEEPEAALYSEKTAHTAEIEDEEIPLGAMQKETDEEQGLRLLWGLLILIIFIAVSARILYKNSKQKNN